jgi:hypothetical protein
VYNQATISEIIVNLRGDFCGHPRAGARSAPTPIIPNNLAEIALAIIIGFFVPLDPFAREENTEVLNIRT